MRLWDAKTRFILTNPNPGQTGVGRSRWDTGRQAEEANTMRQRSVMEGTMNILLDDGRRPWQDFTM